MKVRLPRQQFLDALVAVSALTSTRTTKPIFACVRLTATARELRVRATDGEAAASVTLDCLDGAREGDIVVTNERLLNIVREMGDVEILLEAGPQEAIIRGEGSEFKIFVQDPADFPPIPDFDDQPDLTLDGLGLRRAITLTVFAAARETGRYAINGVLWQKRGKVLTLVATDGRRLAKAQGPVAKADAEDFEAIVPIKALTVFERLCVPRDPDGWSVDVIVKPNQLLMRSGRAVLITALVEGHFPDYEAVIPKGSDKTARLDRQMLHSAVRRAALLTAEDTRAIRFSFEGDVLTLTSRSPEEGEAHVEIPLDFEGTKIEIAFNPNFLIDALRALDGEQVTFKLTEGGKPAVLRSEVIEGFLYVIMPVAL